MRSWCLLAAARAGGALTSAKAGAYHGHGHHEEEGRSPRVYECAGCERQSTTGGEISLHLQGRNTSPPPCPAPNTSLRQLCEPTRPSGSDHVRRMHVSEEPGGLGDLRGVWKRASRRKRGSVALRPRLSPGVLFSMAEVNRRPNVRGWPGMVKAPTDVKRRLERAMLAPS
jgi:hypothetical protein